MASAEAAKAAGHSAAQRMDRVDALAALYLALPVALFCAGWLQPVAGAALGFALLLLLVPFWRPSTATLARHWLIGAGALALAWTAFGGAGHFFYANAVDWTSRDAVLRDLVALHWPVYYATDTSPAIALRAPVAYFLAPAALAKVFGLASADWLLYAWTSLGVLLAVCLGLQATADRRHRLLWLLLLPWFSGMDALGWFLRVGDFKPGEHLEWWAVLYQYSSNSTLLFWVPNHAIPGWLAAGWILKHWKRDTMWLAAMLLLAVLPLWAPLHAVPFAVLGLAWGIADRRRFAGQLQSPRVLLLVPSATIALATGLWVTSGTAGSVPAGFTIMPFAWEAGLERLVSFEAIEFALLGLLVWRVAPRSIAIPVALVLVALPFFKMGLANDLVMRASIIPLALLWWYTAAAITAGPVQQDWRRAAAVVLLAIGAITPAQEVLRALIEPRWQPDLARSFPEKLPMRTQPHYYVDSRNYPPLVARFIRPPGEVGAFAVPRER